MTLVTSHLGQPPAAKVTVPILLYIGLNLIIFMRGTVRAFIKRL